jgi:hypothetical protein
VTQQVADVGAYAVVAELPGIDGYAHSGGILSTPNFQLPTPKETDRREFLGSWELSLSPAPDP